MRSLVMGVFACAWGAISCKPTATTDDKRSSGGGRKQLAELFATGQNEIRRKGNFYYALFKRDYELKFDALPQSASVDDSNIPYVGSWYPQVYGGTGVKAGSIPSALEKYDTVFHGGTNKAAQWEQQNHTVASSDPNSDWKGHCNGFSASAQRHAEPLKDVTRGSTTFTAKDIKALLAEIHMSAKFYFLGGNRCELADSATLPMPSNRADLLSMSECEDVNPGTFHVAIANWIGIQKHALIFDTYSKQQIWNYPHYKYSSVVKSIDAGEAMRLITGTKKTPYSFNPNAVDFRSVVTTVYYSEAFGHEMLTSEVASGSRYKTDIYNYVIELDSAGKIIGGEWYNSEASQNQKAISSIQDHPDFVWVALQPDSGDGSATAANPNLEPAEVIKLWAESVNKDPANPPLDVLQPDLAIDWGKFPKFDVAINGLATGTVFLGTTPRVRLTRREPLAGDVSVALKLDGKDAGSTSASGSDPITLDLNGLTSGIHQLDLYVKKNGTDADYQRVRIQAL